MKLTNTTFGDVALVIQTGTFLLSTPLICEPIANTK
jgi:hypothetical protein